MKKIKCINEEDVPCDKARSYMKKHGMLCDNEPEPQKRSRPVKEKKSRIRSLVDEWLG